MVQTIAEVYDALRSAGADEDKARAAAKAIAGQWDPDRQALRPAREAHGQVGGAFHRVEDRFDRLEQRVSRPEADVGIIQWMLGFTLTFQVATLFFVWQLMLRLPT